MGAAVGAIRIQSTRASALTLTTTVNLIGGLPSFAGHEHASDTGNPSLALVRARCRRAGVGGGTAFPFGNQAADTAKRSRSHLSMRAAPVHSSIPGIHAPGTAPGSIRLDYDIVRWIASQARSGPTRRTISSSWR